MNYEIASFIDQVDSIHETDYGDFMRKANTYLNNLKTKIGWISDPNIERTLVGMQNYLQYTPSWNLESTRKELIRDAREIDDLMLGLKQDWESGDFMDNPLF